MERNYSIDLIKFFAILSVLVIHIFPKDNQIGLFILDNVSRFAVPFFFTASGYFFGKKMKNNRDSKRAFTRYIIKLLKLYLCWLFFYIVIDVLMTSIGTGNPRRELKEYINHFTFPDLVYYGKGTSGYQLWFLTALIWSFVILFVFYKFKKINHLLLISLLLNIIGLFGQSYSVFYAFPISTRDSLFIGLFYTTLGFFFAFNERLKRSIGKSVKIQLIIIFCLLTIQVSEGYLLEKVLSAAHGEYFLSTIILTFVLFCFALNNNNLGKNLFITEIDGRSLGIYVVHVFYIEIYDLILSHLNMTNHADSLLIKLFKLLIIFSISYLTYDFLQFLKRRLGKKK